MPDGEQIHPPGGFHPIARNTAFSLYSSLGTQTDSVVPHYTITRARIVYERVNADTGEEVPWDRLVKGYEHEEGQFILLSEDDMETVRPELTKTIEITEFVALDEIDPILFDKPYYLEPEKRGFKAYSLLREALRSTRMAGISRVVIRTREYLSAMFVRGDVLMVMLLRFPQEIRLASTLELPAATDGTCATFPSRSDSTSSQNSSARSRAASAFPKSEARPREATSSARPAPTGLRALSARNPADGISREAAATGSSRNVAPGRNSSSAATPRRRDRCVASARSSLPHLRMENSSPAEKSALDFPTVNGFGSSTASSR